MTIQKGEFLLLKIRMESGYQTLGGLKTTRLVINNPLIDVTTKESSGWRELLADAGISSLSIAASGIFTDSYSEQQVREYCLKRQIKPYLLQFGNGDQIYGDFLISSYERTGNYNDEENYSITLESSGKIDYSTGK